MDGKQDGNADNNKKYKCKAEAAEYFNHKTDSLFVCSQCNIIVFILHIMIKL